MQMRMSYLLELLIVLLFGSSIVLWADSGVCPIHFTEDKVMLDLPQEEVFTLREDYSVPRDQVLLEVLGRTT